MTAHFGALLVVDDDEDNRDLLCLLLAREGYATASAEGGQQALEQVGKRRFDLVLLDITMPDLDGIEVLKLIRQRYTAAELPVIMATGKHQSEDVVEALSAGANDYVTKPIDFPVVLARIRTQLARKQAEEALRVSEERYALAVRGANDGLWDWNLITNEVHFSPQWKAILGYAESQVANTPHEWFGRVHPDDIEQLRGKINRHLEGALAQFESEHRVLHADGSYRWVLSRGQAVRNTEGEVYRMAGSLTDITENKVADALTGLPNRLLFLDRLGRAIERTRRRQEYVFAVLLIDLDRFKVINDSLGHAVGDQLLFAFARRLEARLRSSDTVARPGGGHTFARLEGDEFAILIDDIHHVSDALRVAERVHQLLASPFALNGREVFTTASIGIAVSTTGYERAEDLLRDAGTAMHRAKIAGNAQSEVFDTAMHTNVVARLQLETDLRRAVERQELRVYYQAIVSLRTGKIAGFEALARWQHPQRGLVSPVEFIPVAEETGLIIPIGAWILKEACHQIRTWQQQFPADPPLMISINLSGKQFVQPDLVDSIRALLQTTGLAPRNVKLEITESVLMDDAASATTILGQLRTLGTRLGLDDFGTGYSSLSYLHHFPFDTLKIDRSFVSRIGAEGENAEIVKTIVTLAHSLNLEVIAEGIETVEQLDHLRGLGCEYGQGHFFSKPIDRNTTATLLTAAPHWGQ
jgi:diguanylate cyclase (GGDEF)-like protein/PAS domain S-box-containing protein